MHGSLYGPSRRLGLLTALLLTATFILSGSAFAQDVQSDNTQSPVQKSWVMLPTRTGTTLPLYQMKDQFVPGGHKEAEKVKRPARIDQLSTMQGPQTEDPAMQQSIEPMVSVTTGLSFDGIGNNFVGPNGTYLVNSVPPDTDMAVGTTQVISQNNSAFAIFDKTTGAVLAGPYNTNVLWSSLGSSAACAADNDGDGVVKFDQLAQRWIITQFAVSTGGTTGPFAQCVAISKTSDATGAWTVFQFNPSVRATKTDFPDYPKVAVWPDVYSITFDMFNAAGTTYEGAGICGIDRISLLAGNNPTIVCAQLTTSDYALLPVDMDGANYPASGAKALYIEQNSTTNSSTALYMYRAKYNFGAGTVTVDPKITITVSSYTSNTCSNTQQCAPQPTHTGTVENGTFASESKLDTLAFHLMFRAAYRNFGSYESIVLNGPVRRAGSGTNTAIRWYEIRTPFATPTVYQQSTYSPDTTNWRWMGSIAEDHQGNMALGYANSSSTLFPSVYVTGRLNSDTINTMQSETALYTGLNSQVNLSGYAYGYRWGDYTAMMVDPDDCTFWYTGEYLKHAGLFNWSTRVVSFKYSGCSSLASLTSPIPSSTLTSATATFLWTPGTGTPSYTLSAGSTQGGTNYCSTQSYTAGTYTATLSCLPTDGSTFWVRLTTVGSGYQDYQYTAASLQQAQTITFPNPGPLTYGTAPVTLTATATSGLTVTYSVISGPGTVSGSTLTVTGAGTIVVQADQAGNSNWLAAPSVQDSIVVNPAAVTATAGSGSSVYDGATHTPSACVVTGAYTGDLACTNSPTSAGPNVGSTTITPNVTGTGLGNYTITPVNGTYTISQASSVTVVTCPASVTYNGSAQTPCTAAVTGAGGLNQALTVNYSNNVNAGTASASASFAGDANHAGSSNSVNFAIDQAAVTATAGSGSSVYDGATHSPSACVVSGAYTGNLACTNSPTSAGPNVGSTTITPNVTGSGLANFSVTTVNGTYTISQASSVTVVTCPGSVTYNGTAQTPCSAAVTGAGGLNQALTVNYANNLNAGTASASASYPGDANHSASNGSKTFVINAVTLTVVAGNGTMVYGGTVPTISYTASGWIPGEGPSLFSPAPTCTPNVTQSTPVGTYASSCSGAAAPNYTIAYVNGTVSVTKSKAAVSIISNTPNPATVGQGVTVTFKATPLYTGTPTGTVTIKASTGESCSGVLSGGMGSCVITLGTKGKIGLSPAYTGDGNFNASPGSVVFETVQ